MRPESQQSRDRDFLSKDVLMDLSEACALRDRLEHEGKRLVFTNGCFDGLHAGHIRYLTEARSLGDALLVGLNSDRSVKQLKGPDRPFNTEAARATILGAMEAVDGVVIFDETRATALLRRLRPHIYAKGGDYSLETLYAEEREVLKSQGAQIMLLSRMEGLSTTGLLRFEKEKVTSPGAPAVALPARIPAIVGSVSEIVAPYEAVILDQWGVIHDGQSLLPGVEPFLRLLHARSIPVIIMTNSGRTASFNEVRLEERFAIGRKWYKRLLSSFDVLCERLVTESLVPVFPIASEGEEWFFQGAGIPITDDVRAARSIAILSVRPDVQVEDYRNIADSAVERDLPVLCTAQDLQRVVPGTVAPGIGRVTDYFAARGARVWNAGKPERLLYDWCLRELPDVSPNRILSAGDQFSTDVRGANTAGIDSALLLTGATRMVTSCMLRALSPSDSPKWIAGTLA